MEVSEDFQGFVPISIFIADRRIDGKVWKYASHRLLQQIEEDDRRFLPVVEARVYQLEGASEQLVGEFDVLGINKSRVIALQPKDTVVQKRP